MRIDPEILLALVPLLASTVGVAVLCRRLGLSRVQTAIWVLLGTGGLVALFVGAFIAAFGECTTNELDYPLSVQWSPRREFCSESGSPAALGYLALFALPPLVASLGAFLWSRRLGWLAFLVGWWMLLVPFLPFAYINALPYYPSDTTPVLHDPYLRVATSDRPARACYVYAIQYGPNRVEPTDDTERVCVDLAPTQEALALTPEYDQGVTMYGLGWLGRTLTENGMDVGSEWEGLVAERVYRLAGPEAREDAVLVRT